MDLTVATALPPPAAGDAVPDAVHLPPDVARLDAAPPGVLDALVGIGGPLALGASLAPVLHRVELVPSFLIALTGSVAFTLPTLLVAHQAFGFRGEWSVVARAMAWTVVRAGRVSLACVPVALLYAAADQAAFAIWLLLLACQAGLVLLTGARALRATQGVATWEDTLKGGLLALAWAALTGVVGLVLLLAWVNA